MKIAHLPYLVFILSFCSLTFLSCENSTPKKVVKIPINQTKKSEHPTIDSIAILKFYTANSTTSVKSISKGTVDNGTLINGKLFPFYGKNFRYFDQESYLANRAFTSDLVKTIILETYDTLYNRHPSKKFYLMELSNKNGGEIKPHITHQNGMSADFMMPKIRNNKSYSGLDSLGKNHYFLTFDSDGKNVKDTSIHIDFELLAEHIYLLNEVAIRHHSKIEKLIIKITFKDELLQTKYGQLLEKKNVYIVRKLSPLVNALHDEHFHVDFK